jgi:hypothetical protein
LAFLALTSGLELHAASRISGSAGKKRFMAFPRLWPGDHMAVAALLPAFVTVTI